MTPLLTLRSTAEAEIWEAYDYYERQILIQAALYRDLLLSYPEGDGHTFWLPSRLRS